MSIYSNKDNDANQNIRLRAAIKYEVKNWNFDPKISTEIFNRFQKGKENGFYRYRLTLETNYKIGHFGEISLFYRIEKKINNYFSKITNIIGLKYIHTFKIH